VGDHRTLAERDRGHWRGKKKEAYFFWEEEALPKGKKGTVRCGQPFSSQKKREGGAVHHPRRKASDSVKEGRLAST